MCGYGMQAKQDRETFYKLLEKLEEMKITKNITTVAQEEVIELTYLFSGVFISNIYVTEKNNNVLKRITLTKASFMNYMSVKLILLLLSLVIGTYTNNVVTVAFGGFFVCTISNCLAGLYFPISANSKWLQSVAKFMPQY